MNQQEDLKISIITTLPFPLGMASTNRIMNYAKGLSENGCFVSIYCIKPTEKPDKIFNKEAYGQINPFLKYKYLSGTSVLSSKYLNRQIQYIKGVINMCFEILSEKKNKKSTAILYYAFNPIPAILLFIITKLKRIQFYKEVSEFPIFHEKNLSGLNKFLFRHFHYNLFDGLFVMTQRLIYYFQEEKKIKTKYVHLPMTVDYHRFFNKYQDKDNANYIAYCGILNNQKDGTDILLKAFAKISNEFPQLKLNLIGDVNSEAERREYNEIIKKYSLEDRIFFTGRVSNDLIPELLCKAKILVLPRPESLQAEGGFPTKLGEYLSTGNPVIVTKVGEIANYLTDKVNSFLIEPGNIDVLANEIRFVLNNYEEARKIGEKGKEIVLENFNYNIQAKKIIKFIK